MYLFSDLLEEAAVILFTMTLLPELRRETVSQRTKTLRTLISKDPTVERLTMLKQENNIRLKCETGLKS